MHLIMVYLLEVAVGSMLILLNKLPQAGFAKHQNKHISIHVRELVIQLLSSLSMHLCLLIINESL